MSIDERVDGLEQRTRELEWRLALLERPAAAVRPPAEPTRVAAPPPRVERPPVAPAPAAPRAAAPPVSLEDLFGGRVLAWAGGLSLLAGLLFLLVVAVSRGWIGEEARTSLAAATSLGLLLAGVRGYERTGRTDSVLAAAATGIAGLFATLVVATQVYALLPLAVGLALAFAVGAAATVLAVRWDAPGIAALGILGAIESPVLIGADHLPVLFLFVATGSAVGVLVWQRWSWLAFAAFGLATPQWVAWLLGPDLGLPAILLALIGFGTLGIVAAIGFELRTRSDRLDVSSHVLLALNALVLAWAGWAALWDTVGATPANAWLAALAVLHLALAAAGTRSPRVSHTLVLAAVGLGIVLADVAFGAVVEGVPLVVGWVATGVGMAALARTARQPIDGDVALAGLGAHLALALGHAMVMDAPPGGAGGLAAGTALALVAAGCVVSGRLVAEQPRARVILDGAGLVVIAYLGAVMLDGAALTLAWAAEAAALAGLARRGRDPVARVGAFGFLALAGAYGVAVLAPPQALTSGVDSSLAALALLGVAGASLAVARMPGVERRALHALAAIAALYVASVELITAVPGQQGQALLSGMWALVGVGALIAGLVRDRRELRIGALALLALTLAKVGLYDLASLDSMYRVASLVALGGLLLLGAYAWQQLRPVALREQAGTGAAASARATATRLRAAVSPVVPDQSLPSSDSR